MRRILERVVHKLCQSRADNLDREARVVLSWYYVAMEGTHEPESLLTNTDALMN